MTNSAFSILPPTGSAPELLAVFSDVHLGIEDTEALKLAVECCEREGVTRIVANGDIHDCAAVSPHEMKARKAVIESGALAKEISRGRWFVDWMATRPKTVYGTGNHEDWINDAALRTGTVGSLTVRAALNLPDDFVVLDNGYQIRYGNLVIEHGDAILGRGSGGRNVAQSILDRYPEQSTIVGHFHKEAYATRTSVDSRGIFRTRAAYSSGHLSNPLAHIEYAGRAPNWQQGFFLVRLWSDAGRPRFTVHPICIHRTQTGRPVFEFNGHVYRGRGRG